MIKNLTGGPGIVINGGNSASPYINQNTNNPMQGMIRMSGTDFQVFDGSSWIMLATGYPSVGLDGETRDLLQWARTQRTMAMNRLTLAQNNPALLKALEKLKKAEDNFELLSKFVEHNVEGDLHESI